MFSDYVIAMWIIANLGIHYYSSTGNTRSQAFFHITPVDFLLNTHVFTCQSRRSCHHHHPRRSRDHRVRPEQSNDQSTHTSYWSSLSTSDKNKYVKTQKLLSLAHKQQKWYDLSPASGVAQDNVIRAIAAFYRGSLHLASRKPNPYAYKQQNWQDSHNFRRHLLSLLIWLTHLSIKSVVLWALSAVMCACVYIYRYIYIDTHTYQWFLLF